MENTGFESDTNFSNVTVPALEMANGDSKNDKRGDDKAPKITIEMGDFSKDDDFDDEAEFHHNGCTRFIEKLENLWKILYRSFHHRVHLAVKVVLFLAYMVYFAYCMYYRFGDEGSIMLLVITIIFVLTVVSKVMDALGLKINLPVCMKRCMTNRCAKRARSAIRYALYILVSAGIVAYLVIEILRDNPENLQSIIGMFVFIFVCFVFSSKPSRVNWHPVYWGFVIQFIFAFLTLRTDFGYDAFKWLGEAVQTFFNWSNSGGFFMFGRGFPDMGLAFTITAVLIFFNAVLYLLTYWGFVEVVVIKAGKFLCLCLETGPVESVVAAASIFVGPAEVNLIVRPYIMKLTSSEIHAIMTCSFASIAGIAMGFFISIGIPANHLLTAAVISAPAALASAKLVYPETKKVDYTKQTEVSLNEKDSDKSALAAISEGALMAATVIVAVVANLIAFYSLLHMLNEMLDWAGKRAGFDRLSFENREILAGYEAKNGTWHWVHDDIFLEMTNQTLKFGVIEERSEVIATYALCGFSAFTGIAFTAGVLIQLAPSRKDEFMGIVMRAFLAGNMASFFTGTVAGAMFTG